MIRACIGLVSSRLEPAVIVKCFAGEFKLRLDCFRSYMKEVTRKSESRRGRRDGPAVERTVETSQTQANTTHLSVALSTALKSEPRNLHRQATQLQRSRIT
jgi:hypothetical protein